MSAQRPSRRPGFDRVARLYPRMERMVYGQRLEAGRLAYLNELAPCRNVLLLGEGNGRFLRALLASNPVCTATVVEISPRMITNARAMLHPEQRKRVTWHQASVLDVPLPTHAFDTVVTHYLFDLFGPDDQHRLLQTGLRALQIDGIWQDTEFLAEAPTPFLRLRNRLLLAASYRFLGALCDFPARHLNDHYPLMSAAGLWLESEQVFGHHFAARLWKKTDR